jgi:hypothetical protein
MKMRDERPRLQQREGQPLGEPVRRLDDVELHTQPPGFAIAREGPLEPKRGPRQPAPHLRQDAARPSPVDMDAEILAIVCRLTVHAREDVNLVTSPDERARNRLHVRADSAAPRLRRILARQEQDAEGAGTRDQPVPFAASTPASVTIFAG